MAREDPQTNIRLPAELKEKLMEAAKKSNRTFGAEVVMRLETSFRVDGIHASADEVIAISQANAERVRQGLEEMRQLQAAMEAQLAAAAKHLGPAKKK